MTVKTSELPELSSVPADDDLLEIVDVSDTSTAPTGTSKKLQIQRLVQAAASSQAQKAAVRFAARTGVTLATAVPGATLAGVVLSAGMRFHCNAQPDPGDNGIWVVQASGAPQRPDDFAVGSNAAGAVFVSEADARLWVCTNVTGAATVGTSGLTFSELMATVPPVPDSVSLVYKAAAPTAQVRFDATDVLADTVVQIKVPPTHVDLTPDVTYMAAGHAGNTIPLLAEDPDGPTIADALASAGTGSETLTELADELESVLIPEANISLVRDGPQLRISAGAPSGLAVPLVAVSASGTSGTNTRELITVTTGNILRYFPTSPVDGDIVGYRFLGGNTDYWFIVAPSPGQVFWDGSGSVAFYRADDQNDGQGDAVDFQYRAANQTWYPVYESRRPHSAGLGRTATVALTANISTTFAMRAVNWHHGKPYYTYGADIDPLVRRVNTYSVTAQLTVTASFVPQMAVLTELLRLRSATTTVLGSTYATLINGTGSAFLHWSGRLEQNDRLQLRVTPESDGTITAASLDLIEHM